MHWQVDFRFEYCRGKLQLLTVHAHPVGFRWWRPRDWFDWLAMYRRGFTAKARPTARAFIVAEPINSAAPTCPHFEKIEPIRELPPGASILATAGSWDWLDTGTFQIELPEGGRIVLPGEPIESAEFPAD